MVVTKCPMCGSQCIVKLIAMEAEDWTKVDVCEMCLTMYPRGRTVTRIAPKKEFGPKKAKAKANPKKKPKRR